MCLLKYCMSIIVSRFCTNYQPIIGIGRLVRWCQPIVIYTIRKYKSLLHGVPMVEIVVFERGRVGHFEHKFQGEWGIIHQRLLASEC